MTETIFGKNDFDCLVWFKSSFVYMESVGFMTYTATSHLGAINLLHFQNTFQASLFRTLFTFRLHFSEHVWHTWAASEIAFLSTV